LHCEKPVRLALARERDSELMTILSILLLCSSAALLIATAALVVELLVLTAAALLPSGFFSKSRKNGAVSLRLAVIVPAHNEEALIGRCVRSVLVSRPESTEVFVVAHNCNDNTAVEAERAGARVLVLNESSQTGKGCALHHGFSTAMAKGFDAMLVMDADSAASANLIEAARECFAAGAQALQCRYEIQSAGSDRRARLMSVAFRGFNVIRPRGRERLGLSAGIFGNGFGLSREVLTQLPYEARSTTEDLEYHLMLVNAGIRTVFLDAASVVSEAPASAAGTSTQRARWEGGRLRMMKQWSPRLLVKVLGGRVRLIEPLLDLLALPLAFEVGLLAVALCLPIQWLRMYAVGALAVIAFHVLAAAASGPDFIETMKALLTAPIYILWKLWMLPRIWRASRADSPWVRTSRDASV
jgi:cellulose synthase/poly-beta-1,6-N-acetylglucosamine synthase-like glycosyltransferase